MSDAASAFRSGIERLWGYGAQTRAARHFEVSDRSVRAWVSGKTPVPSGVMAELRAMLDIAPPAADMPDDQRDDACREALEPLLTDIRDRAIAAGWHPAEVAAAVLDLAVSEIRAGAGDAAAIETLKAVADGIKAHRGA